MNRNKKLSQPTWAERLYKLLLHFYPPEHRKEFGLQMLQSFKDFYHDVKQEKGRVGASFWLEVIEDEAKSVLREHISAMKGGLKMKSYGFGLVLGIFLVIVVIASNVVVRNFEPDDEYQTTYLLAFGLLLLFFGLVGFVTRRKTTSIVASARIGAITALIGIGLAMLAFFVVDNVFIDIVSKQPDKIYGFQHSNFSSMREYINYGLLQGVITVLPIFAVLGAICGTVGASVQKFRAASASRNQWLDRQAQ